MAHGPSRIESALRGRFALARTGEGIPVSRRVGSVSPWVFLPLLPGRSVNALDDEFIFFLPLLVLCRTLMMIACLVWFLPPSAMNCYNTTIQLSRYKAFASWYLLAAGWYCSAVWRFVRDFGFCACVILFPGLGGLVTYYGIRVWPKWRSMGFVLRLRGFEEGLWVSCWGFGVLMKVYGFRVEASGSMGFGWGFGVYGFRLRLRGFDEGLWVSCV